MHQMKEIQCELADPQSFSLVLLGRNSEGKSSLINRLLSLTCVSNDQYQHTKERKSSHSIRRRSGSKYRDRIRDHLEAVQDLRKTSKASFTSAPPNNLHNRGSGKGMTPMSMSTGGAKHKANRGVPRGGLARPNRP
jgi:GTPase SAR1 family protein